MDSKLVRIDEAYRAVSDTVGRLLISQIDNDMRDKRYGEPLSYGQKLNLVDEALWLFRFRIAELEQVEMTEIPTPRRAIPEVVRRGVLARDGSRCLNCGSAADLHIDHVVPLAVGGTHEESNFQTLCGPCNSKKGTQAVDYRLDELPQEKVLLQAVEWLAAFHKKAELSGADISSLVGGPELTALLEVASASGKLQFERNGDHA